MYEELIKALRVCGDMSTDQCDGCFKVDTEDEMRLDCEPNLKHEAADAIEELEADKASLNGTVTNLLEQIKDIASPRWIPVTERLPKGGDKSGGLCENVWLYLDDGNVYPGWMNGITEKVYYIDDRNDVLMKAPISRVKMWQPKPEPPKEET